MLQKYSEAKFGSFLLPKESATVMRDLSDSDRITFMVKQSKLSDAISPSVVVTTSKKLIIVNRKLAGLKSHITFIPYAEIAGAQISHGMIFSSIFLRMKGAQKELKIPKGEKESGEIKGLDREDADLLFVHLNRMINGDSPIEYISTAKVYAAPVVNAPAPSGGIQHRQFHSIDILSLYRKPAVQVSAGMVNEVIAAPQTGEAAVERQAKPAEARKVTADDLLIFKMRKKTVGIHRVLKPFESLLAKPSTVDA